MSKTSKELVKRLLAVALTLVMVIGFMPVAAIPVYATEIGAEETPAPSTEPSEEPSTDDGETSSIPENAIVIKDGVYLTITTNNDLVYDGSSKNLIENAGVYTTSETGEEIPAEGYTVEFTEDSEEPKKYDEFNKFKATDAGTYELFYRVTEGGASVKEDSVKIVISQAESYEGEINGKTGLTYNGKEQELLDKATFSQIIKDNTITIKFGDTDYEVTDKTSLDKAIKSITAKDAGDYSITVSIQNKYSNNYKASEYQVKVTIAKFEHTATVYEGRNLAGTEKTLDIKDAKNITYTLKQDAIPGEYEVKLKNEDADIDPSGSGNESDLVSWTYDKDKSSIKINQFKSAGRYQLIIINKSTDENNCIDSEAFTITFTITAKAAENTEVSFVDSSSGTKITEPVRLNVNDIGQNVAIKAELTGNYSKLSGTFSFDAAGIDIPDIQVNKNDAAKSTKFTFNEGDYENLLRFATEEKISVKPTLKLRLGWNNYERSPLPEITLALDIVKGNADNFTITAEDGEAQANGWYNADVKKITITAPEGCKIIGYTLSTEKTAVPVDGLNSITIDKSTDGVEVYYINADGDVAKVQLVNVKYDTKAPTTSIVDNKQPDVIGKILSNIFFGVGKNEKGKNTYSVTFTPTDNFKVAELNGNIWTTTVENVYQYATDYADWTEKMSKYTEAPKDPGDRPTEKNEGESDDEFQKRLDIYDEARRSYDAYQNLLNNEPALKYTNKDPEPLNATKNDDGTYTRTIETDGVLFIEYWAVDEAGNKEGSKFTGNYESDGKGNPILDKNEKPVIHDYLVIDNTAPKIEVTIKSNEAVNEIDGKEYYKNAVTISASVNEVNYKLISETHEEGEWSSDHGTLLTIAVTGGKTETVKDINGTQGVSIDLNEDGDYTVTISCEDPSGNETTIERNIVVDTTKPVLSATLKDYNGYKGDVSEGKYYFNGAAAAGDEADTENVTSRLPSFDISLIDKNPNLDKGVDAVIGEESDNITVAGEGETYTGTYTMDKADGEYKFHLTHTDLAKNDGESDEYGTYIIDRVAPELNVTFNNAANTIGDTHYYNGNIEATFTVTEKYFAEKWMELSINGAKEDKFSFSQNGDIYTANKTLVANGRTDGNYQLVVTGTDKAGNVLVGERVDENGKYTSENFVIDTQITAPTIGGVEPGHAYKDKDISVSVKGDDTNFDQMTVVITKTYMANENGKTVQKTAEVYNETFYTGNTYSYRVPDGRDADGIYVVTATIRDKATNTATSTPVTFTVNRYGSVYEYVSGITEVNGKYVQKVGEELVIWEYSATELEGNNESLMKNVGIYVDGSKIDASDIKVELEHQNGGWYKYIYTIPTVNFDTDAHYKVEISSESVNGVRSSNTKIQNLVAIDFFKDGTAPVLENVTGMEKSIYNEAEHEIKFNIYDSIGLASVKVLVNDTEVFVKEDFEDAMNYEGSVTLDESDSKQHVRFIITDLAGNVTDTDADGFDPDYTFERDLVISTNFWVRLRANTPLLIGCIAGVVVILALGVILIIRKKDKKEEEKTAAAK